jgi:hypothetical protein
LTDQENELFDEHVDEICEGCPWHEESHHPETLCEGCCCKEAFEIWKEDNV